VPTQTSELPAKPAALLSKGRWRGNHHQNYGNNAIDKFHLAVSFATALNFGPMPTNEKNDVTD
jgi:carbon storage regulator CsrA